MSNQETVFWIVTVGLSVAAIGGFLFYCFGAIILSRWLK